MWRSSKPRIATCTLSWTHSQKPRPCVVPILARVLTLPLFALLPNLHPPDVEIHSFAAAISSDLHAESMPQRCEVDDSKKKARSKDANPKKGPGKAKPPPAVAVSEARRERRRKSILFLKAQLQFAVSTDRRQAIQRIPELEESERKEVLPTLLSQAGADSDPLVREASLRMLGRLKHLPAVPTLIKALDDENSEILAAAIGAIGNIEAAAAGPRLFELIQNRNLHERNDINDSIVRALGKLQHTPAVEFLRKKAQDKETHEQTRQSILLFLGDLKDGGAREYLQKIAADTDQPVLSRAYAVNALGRIGNRADSPQLQKILAGIRAMRNGAERAKLSGLRLYLISALIRLGDRSVEEELYAAARDDDVYVRTRAIKQLGELKLAAARPLLCFKYKHDPSPAVRRTARRAIMSVDGKEPQ